MTKKQKQKIDTMFYMPVKEGNEGKEEKRKSREREKRIKQNQKVRERKETSFDQETETVINMTNRNNEKKVQAQRRVTSKQQRAIERKKKKIKRIIKWTSLLFILAGGITFALVSPIFNITGIEVKDNKQVPAETIVSLSELVAGQNIFQFINQRVEGKVEQNPYIKTVQISRRLPGTVRIKVEERTKRYSVEFLNGYAYMDSQGYLLEIAEDGLELPIIQGVTTPEEKIKPGNRLETTDLERLETVIQIIDAAKSAYLDAKVTSIDIRNKNEYSMYMQEEKKTIHLGDGTNLSNKMLWVQAILEDNKGKEGEIFVNGDLNNKFKPRFREKV